MSSCSASTTEGPGRQGIVNLIVQHGSTELAARAAVRLAEALLAKMNQEPDADRQREHAGMIDTRTGEPLGAITVGTRRGVGFADQIHAALDHGVTSAIAVHPHPGSSSFSEAAATAFDQAPLVTVLVVAGADGTWYVLRLRPSATPPTEDEIETRFRDVFDHLTPKYRAMIHDGMLTPEHSWQDLMHETWDVIASGLGLR